MKAKALGGQRRKTTGKRRLVVVGIEAVIWDRFIQQTSRGFKVIDKNLVVFCEMGDTVKNDWVDHFQGFAGTKTDWVDHFQGFAGTALM
ncbi:hypothetical protein BDE02_01G373700 [Populus trichocarpa]|nr:hypothetical protein BDE02_01G373700 [Populus trichocarpa]